MKAGHDWISLSCELIVAVTVAAAFPISFGAAIEKLAETGRRDFPVTGWVAFSTILKTSNHNGDTRKFQAAWERSVDVMACVKKASVQFPPAKLFVSVRETMFETSLARLDASRKPTFEIFHPTER